MLVSLTIKNFAIVKQLEVLWHQQMTTITGETGAGKSIAIDALAQALGERSDAGMVRAGADKAEIVANFDIHQLPSAQQWLQAHELDQDGECLLRRVISKEGRSKAYINGSPVPASQLKSLANFLVSIHGQHAHQLLTKNEHQRLLLDEYAGHSALLQQTKANFDQWQALRKELRLLQTRKDEFSAQQQLLSYQVEELANAEICEGEFAEIEQEHQRLHHAQSLLSDSQQALNILHEEDSGNAYSALQSALSLLHKSATVDQGLNPTVELIEGSLIQLQEGVNELRSYAERVELNPERLFEIEQRLNIYMDLSRKHHVGPNELAAHFEHLQQELDKLSHSDERLSELTELIEKQQNLYFDSAERLSQSRQQFALELNEKITASLEHLNMAGAKFEIDIQTDREKASAQGIDKLEFLVCANKGQQLQPLAKVASGGELSRISLAIQVIIAQRVTTPTLLFDEVDVGVSGPTASAIGKLMRKLAAKTQVICVTHLPQVACYGHQQQFVEKQVIDDETQTSMYSLDDQGRIAELARLLGGDIISDTTKANAKELLNTAKH